MQIDDSQVKWDEPAAIDKNSIQWDDAPKQLEQSTLSDKLKSAFTLISAAPSLYSGATKELVPDVAAGIASGAASIPTSAMKIIRAINPWDKLENKSGTELAIEEFNKEREGKLGFRIPRLATQIAGTAGTGQLLAKGLSSAIPSLSGSSQGQTILEALRTSGMTKGVDMGTRMAAGAAVGGASSGMIDPESAGQGMAIGAALPPGFAIVGSALKWVGGLGKDISQTAREILSRTGKEETIGRIMRESSGENNVPAVIEALKTASPEETMGQATRQLSIPELSAAQKYLEKIGPTKPLFDVKKAQELAKIQTMQDVTPDIKTLERLRDEITSPMRTAELEAANTAGIKGQELYDKGAQKFSSLVSATQNKGQLATNAAQQKVLSENFYPVEGMPRIAAKYSHNIERVPENLSGAEDFAKIAAQRRAELNLSQYQLDSIKAHGLDTLKSDSIVNSIDKTLNVPGTRASDVVQKSLGYFKDKLASLTDERGIIDARDLYTVRKEIGNNIQNFAKESGNWDKKMTAGLQRDVQKSIDEAITKAGGDGWNKYLQTYSKFSNAIERSKTMEEMISVIAKPGGGERKVPFLNAMKTSEGELAKLTPTQRGAISKVSSELEGQLTDEELAKVGREAFNKIIGKNENITTIPILHRTATIGNAILRKLSGKGGQEVDRIFANATLPENKALLIKYMNMAEPADREAIKAAIEAAKQIAPKIIIPSTTKENKKTNHLSELSK